MGLLFLSGTAGGRRAGPGGQGRGAGGRGVQARLLPPALSLPHPSRTPLQCAQRGSQGPPRACPLVWGCALQSPGHKTALLDSFMLRISPATSSFIPSVKFPVTSMGRHVQNTCRLWDLRVAPGAEPGLCGLHVAGGRSLETSARGTIPLSILVGWPEAHSGSSPEGRVS